MRTNYMHGRTADDVAGRLYEEIVSAWMDESGDDRETALRAMLEDDLVADITMRCPEDDQPNSGEVEAMANIIRAWAREELSSESAA